MAMLLVLGLTVLCIICDDERVTWGAKDFISSSQVSWTHWWVKVASNLKLKLFFFVVINLSFSIQVTSYDPVRC
jgi:hypothetical protein